MHIYMFYGIILLLNIVASNYKASFMVAFIVCTLTVLSSFSMIQVQAKSPYDSGYDHGCSDVNLPYEEQYSSQPGKGPEHHTDEFNQGYDDGYVGCSGAYVVPDSEVPQSTTSNSQPNCKGAGLIGGLLGGAVGSLAGPDAAIGGFSAGSQFLQGTCESR